MSKSASPLKITGLTKSYGSQISVEDISLNLKKGEVFGFLGPNGAGKSTTIRTVLNFLHPSKGSVSIFGLDSVRDSVRAKRRIGYLAGDIALYDTMTGRKLLRYLASLRGGVDWEYVTELERKLVATLDKPIHTLSKGNKQKIGLIQAFMHKPDLIVLDEPASGLDPLMKQAFYDMVRDASSNGATIFVSSHDLTEVQKICHRIAFIKDGKIVATESIKQTDKLSIKRYRVTFMSQPTKKQLKEIPGVHDVAVDEGHVVLSVTGNINEFIKGLSKFNVTDFDSEEVSLEELFIHHYQATGSKKEERDE